MRKAGIMAKGSSLAELAGRIGIDPARLQANADRFNGFARSGVDGNFGRGNSAYDRYHGDPAVHPNACLDLLEKGPLTALLTPRHHLSGPRKTSAGPHWTTVSRQRVPGGAPGFSSARAPRRQ